MKKFLAFGCLLVALVLSGCSALPELNQSVYEPSSEPQSSLSSDDDETFSFIVPDWVEAGMKEGEVRQHFSESPHNYVEGSISYDIEDYNGFNLNYLHFGFTENNQLYGIIYQLSKFDSISSSTNIEYSNLYEKLKKELTNLYGAPTDENIDWIDERYKDDDYMLNQAIENGDCVFTTIWNRDDMTITLEMNSGISIMYAFNGVMTEKGTDIDESKNESSSQATQESTDAKPTNKSPSKTTVSSEPSSTANVYKENVVYEKVIAESEIIDRTWAADIEIVPSDSQQDLDIDGIQ